MKRKSVGYLGVTSTFHLLFSSPCQENLLDLFIAVELLQKHNIVKLCSNNCSYFLPTNQGFWAKDKFIWYQPLLEHLIDKRFLRNRVFKAFLEPIIFLSQ